MTTTDVQRLRRVNLPGTVNLRDLGGYHTKDGTKTTKWGVLYRGDQLSAVPADVAQKVLVGELHIHNAFDLRGSHEVARQFYHIPHINRYAMPVDMRHITQQLQDERCLRDGHVVLHTMQNMYREFARLHGHTFGAAIKGFLNSNPSPENATLIHCTAGKDRTGWVAYLILSLLDIDEQEKRRDFMLTNMFLSCPKELSYYLCSKGMSRGVMRALWTVFEEFLDAGVDEVNKLGGMAVYARTCLRLTDEDIQKLRTVMLT